MFYEITKQARYKRKTALEKKVSFEKMILQRVIGMRFLQPHVGCRKLQKMLVDPNYGLPVEIGRDKLFNLLEANNMLVKNRRSFQQTTDSKHSLPSYPNLLKDLKVRYVNQVWVCDITYLQLQNMKFCYLFLVTDYFSRKIIGYALKTSLATDGAIEALQMAVRYAKPAAGFIHHSDHGVQYCSKNYVDLLGKYSAQISMTGENHCYDNAVAERINGILKQEFGLGSVLASLEAAKKLTDQGIKVYNDARLHVSLGYRTPSYTYDLYRYSAEASA
jgi:transposase InsO family protein